MAIPICVIGSCNTDMVVKAERLPLPGETIIGGTFLMNPGGKGANQAVTASRLGGDVTFVAKVGNDIFGRQAFQQFQKENINSTNVVTDKEHPSGVALIGVDANGENSIIVAPGSNAYLDTRIVQQALNALEDNAIVLLQLEIPIETVEFAVEQCHDRGLTVILNPAPVQPLNTNILKYLSFITPNEYEAEMLTGIKIKDIVTAEQAARKLYAMGVPNVIITLGAKGAFLYNEKSAILIPAPLVTAVDTTAAGDCFNGALAVALSERLEIRDAVTFACKAASIAVTRMGAQSSIPNRREVEELKIISL